MNSVECGCLFLVLHIGFIWEFLQIFHSIVYTRVGRLYKHSRYQRPGVIFVVAHHLASVKCSYAISGIILHDFWYSTYMSNVFKLCIEEEKMEKSSFFSFPVQKKFFFFFIRLRTKVCRVNRIAYCDRRSLYIFPITRKNVGCSL